MVILFGFLGWAFLLIDWHYRQFAKVRTAYLRGEDDPNHWRALHMAEADGTMVHSGGKMASVVAELKYKHFLEVLEKEQDQTERDLAWWRK